LLVFVHEVIAAITTEPCPIVVPVPATSARVASACSSSWNPRSLGRLGQVRLEVAGRRRERHAVLRALRTREARLHAREVERQLVGELGHRRGRRAEQALGRVVVAHELDLRLVAAGLPQVRERLLVDREEADRRAVLGRHVRDGRAVGEGHRAHALAPELDELLDDALLAQHLRDRQHEVGRGHAVRELALQLEADHVRDQHVDRLPEHDGLGLDAADAPAEHAEPVDHRRVRVGADDRVGERDRGAAVGLGQRDAGEVLEVDLVHDAGRRRNDAEVRERELAPLEELVALAVARELELDVLVERVRGPEVIDLDRSGRSRGRRARAG
jgi:hypothetical protein